MEGLLPVVMPTLRYKLLQVFPKRGDAQDFRSEVEQDDSSETLLAIDDSGYVVTKSVASTSSTTPAATRKVNVLENTPEVTRVSVGFENNRGNLPWPVDRATVTAGFGRQKIEGTSIIEDNIGLTIQTVSGSNVKAVFDGTVTTVYDVAGSQTVTIKHGKYFTTYYNLSSVNVSKGTAVKMGQAIGKAAQNDDGDGEIIFVVNVESKFVNPEDWLKNR